MSKKKLNEEWIKEIAGDLELNIYDFRKTVDGWINQEQPGLREQLRGEVPVVKIDGNLTKTDLGILLYGFRNRHERRKIYPCSRLNILIENESKLLTEEEANKRITEIKTKEE